MKNAFLLAKKYKIFLREYKSVVVFSAQLPPNGTQLNINKSNPWKNE